jgi:hypothetical protein
MPHTHTHTHTHTRTRSRCYRLCAVGSHWSRCPFSQLRAAMLHWTRSEILIYLFFVFPLFLSSPFRFITMSIIRHSPYPPSSIIASDTLSFIHPDPFPHPSSILHPHPRYFILHPSQSFILHQPTHHPPSVIHHPSSILRHPSLILYPSSHLPSYFYIIHHPSSIIHHPSSTIHLISPSSYHPMIIHHSSIIHHLSCVIRLTSPHLTSPQLTSVHSNHSFTGLHFHGVWAACRSGSYC